MELIKSIFNWKFKQLLKVQTQLMEEKLNWKIHYVLIKLSVFLKVASRIEQGSRNFRVSWEFGVWILQIQIFPPNFSFKFWQEKFTLQKSEFNLQRRFFHFQTIHSYSFLWIFEIFL
jgi:hypothetical protein